MTRSYTYIRPIYSAGVEGTITLSNEKLVDIFLYFLVLLPNSQTNRNVTLYFWLSIDVYRCYGILRVNIYAYVRLTSDFSAVYGVGESHDG